jgi:hypothetical protein
MIASVIRFSLPPETDWDALRDLARQRAHEFYRDLPGLRSKAFIIDAERGVYGGLYTWTSRAALDDFLASEVFRGIVARLGEPVIETFEVPAYVEAGAVLEGTVEATA